MSVKKYQDFIKESNISPLEIKEFAKEEASNLISDLYERMAKKFPIDSSELSNDEKLLQEKILTELTDLVSQVTINNISSLNKKIQDDLDDTE
jgi:hypothetical protein